MLDAAYVKKDGRRSRRFATGAAPDSASAIPAERGERRRRRGGAAR
jgi:hypothetical protein